MARRELYSLRRGAGVGWRVRRWDLWMPVQWSGKFPGGSGIGERVSMRILRGKWGVVVVAS